MPPASKPAQLTLALAVLVAVEVLGIPAVLHVALGTPRVDTVLHHAESFVAGRQREDSWKPMERARAFLDRSPGGRVYEALFFGEGVKFQYPPSSLLIAGAADRPTLNVVSRLAVLATGALTLLLLEQSLRAWAPAWRAAGAIHLAVRGAIVLGLTIGFYPVVKAYTLGQIQAWLTPLVAASLLLLATGRAIPAGAAVGMAALVKPTYGAWLIWALVRKAWRAAGGFLLVLVAGVAISTAAYGIVQWRDYARVLSYIGERGESFYANQSINGLVNRLRQNGPILAWQRDRFAPVDPVVRAATPLAGAALAAFALVWRRLARRGSPALDAAAFLLAATIGAPIAWEHHYGIVLPIAALATGPVLAAPRPAVRLAALAAGVLLTGQYLAVTHGTAGGALNVVMSYTLAGAVLLLGLLLSLPSAGDLSARGRDR